MLNTSTRLRLEELLGRIELGRTVELQERVDLQNYANVYPMIAGRLKRALGN